MYISILSSRLSLLFVFILVTAAYGFAQTIETRMTRPQMNTAQAHIGQQSNQNGDWPANAAAATSNKATTTAPLNSKMMNASSAKRAAPTTNTTIVGEKLQSANNNSGAVSPASSTGLKKISDGPATITQ